MPPCPSSLTPRLVCRVCPCMYACACLSVCGAAGRQIPGAAATSCSIRSRSRSSLGCWRVQHGVHCVPDTGAGQRDSTPHTAHCTQHTAHSSRSTQHRAHSTTVHSTTAHSTTAPQHTAPQYTVPQHTAPQHTAPQYTVAEHTAPQYTVAQHSKVRSRVRLSTLSYGTRITEHGSRNTLHSSQRYTKQRSPQYTSTYHSRHCSTQQQTAVWQYTAHHTQHTAAPSTQQHIAHSST
jgi:hypothetical protein